MAKPLSSQRKDSQKKANSFNYVTASCVYEVVFCFFLKTRILRVQYFIFPDNPRSHPATGTERDPETIGLGHAATGQTWFKEFKGKVTGNIQGYGTKKK